MMYYAKFDKIKKTDLPQTVHPGYVSFTTLNALKNIIMTICKWKKRTYRPWNFIIKKVGAFVIQKNGGENKIMMKNQRRIEILLHGDCRKQKTRLYIHILYVTFRKKRAGINVSG